MATKRKPMAKPRQKESPCHEGDPSKKSREVRKTGQSEKGSGEGAAPARSAPPVVEFLRRERRHTFMWQRHAKERRGASNGRSPLVQLDLR